MKRCPRGHGEEGGRKKYRITRRKFTAVGSVGNRVLKRSGRAGEGGGTTKNSVKENSGRTVRQALSVCLLPLSGRIWHLVVRGGFSTDCPPPQNHPSSTYQLPVLLRLRFPVPDWPDSGGFPLSCSESTLYLKIFFMIGCNSTFVCATIFSYHWIGYSLD